MSNEEIREDVKNKIEEYHQDNFYQCYPAGIVMDWVLDAVVERIVLPMIEAGKEKLQK